MGFGWGVVGQATNNNEGTNTNEGTNNNPIPTPTKGCWSGDQQKPKTNANEGDQLPTTDYNPG
jgi:hypothetical protein